MKAIPTLLAASASLALAATNNSKEKEQWTPITPERHAHIQSTKSARMAERRERVRRALANPTSKLNRLTDAEIADITNAAVEKEVAAASVRGGAGWEEKVDTLKKEGGRALEGEEHQWIRRVNVDASRSPPGGYAMSEEERKLWGNTVSGYNPYSASGLAENTQYYDKWQQAYRFLGGFIDCDHSWSQGSHDKNNNNNRNQNNNQNGNSACSRWMMWAAYIDPNYAGGGYDEYFGDDAPGVLDCHSPDSDWVLIGVYRQEFYQYIEQISKHLWAIDEYEYIVALAGLKYMTKNECFGVGYDENGNQLYAAVQPISGGKFQMGLYSDSQCLYVNTDTSYTYDDFGEKSDLYLGSKDQTDDDAFHAQAYQYWYDTQEYTFENLNTVYQDFKFCTSCVDYPTYQDGYFIGDDGKDDDDLINQCWKFYSHSSYNCDADCIAMGAAQGTITWINYNGKQFGNLIDGQYDSTHEGTKLGDSGTTITQSSASSDGHRLERLKANLFLTVAGIVFVATFLAFAVARGSSKKKVKSTSRSRSRRLLDEDYDGERRSSRSISARSTKSRSKSRSGLSSSKSRSKSRSRVKGDYVPPVDSTRSSDREKKSSDDEKRRRSSSKKRHSSSRRDEF
ncbi:hypothetical protein HJC23_000216 [Cyclotella cryptica]|uniref:Uncharacterized protein n=1 Tax=Cyclotella cryptica TaxID=29204 RepID=A0ABD3PME4_9STRA|eukprot:CCRYP_013380-RA/>CCRYP_013380-RA protein AED:0.03 eAED:0.03 QI:307/1/1/1/1/1/3/195/622